MNLSAEYEPSQDIKEAWKHGNIFEQDDIVYSPKYKKGEIIRYEGDIHNLKIFIYNNKITVSNSLHKFWHSNNFNDFYADEIKQAIELLSELTKVAWKEAEAKQLEYGCNILTNSQQAVNSLHSHKGKSFEAMTKYGKKYGASCDYTEHGMKGYNKTYEVFQTSKVKLKESLFRWEVYITRMRSIQGMVNLPMKGKDLYNKDILKVLAEDAVNKYKHTIKGSKLQFHRLSFHQKSIIAMMRDEEIKQDIKLHHKESYKKYVKEFKRIMQDITINPVDGIEQDLVKKFDQLINGVPTCSIVGKRGTILPKEQKVLV